MGERRITLRVETRSADSSPSRLHHSVPGPVPDPSRLLHSVPVPVHRSLSSKILQARVGGKDDIVLSKYEMFTPTAKEECSRSLARVMEIQRQAALGHINATNTLARTDDYPGFMQHHPAGNLGDAKSHELLDLGGGGGMSPPFLDLCQSIEEAANKRSEKTKPLPCPKYPKLPPKRRHKSSNNGNMQETRSLISLKNQELLTLKANSFAITSEKSEDTSKLCSSTVPGMSNICFNSSFPITTNTVEVSVLDSKRYNSSAKIESIDPQVQLQAILQRLEGKIEDISCKDLVDLRADVYFLILQTLKEKAIELEKLIDKKSRNIQEEGLAGSYGFHSLEKDLIKVIPSMNLVRKLLVLSGLYNQAQVVTKIKQVEIQTCLFTLHTFDCLVFKHSWDVQQTVRKKEELELELKTLNIEEAGKNKKMQELEDINSYLQNANESLYSCVGGLSLLEHDLLVLRQDLQTMAQKQMSKGAKQSMETLAIETELREVQQRANELQKKAKELTEQLETICKGKSSDTKSPPSSIVSKEDLLNTIKVNVAVIEASLSKITFHKTDSPSTLSTHSLNKSAKEESSSKVGANLVPNISSPTEDSETEKKYLELVDLLTVRMFEGSSNIEKPPEQKHYIAKDHSSSKKSNSLPRTLDVSASVSRGLHKSSSNQNFSPEPQSGPGLSAYERLFGRPKPGSRPQSPLAAATPITPGAGAARDRKRVPVFIPKARSRSRNVSGSPMRSSLCGSKQDIRQSSRSAENVSVMGTQQRRMMPPPDILSDISRHDKYDQMSDVICQLSDVLGQRDKMMSRGTSGVRRTEEEENEAETMSDVQSCLNYIDGLLATPEMINIPERGANKSLQNDVDINGGSGSQQNHNSIRKMFLQHGNDNSSFSTSKSNNPKTHDDILATLPLKQQRETLLC